MPRGGYRPGAGRPPRDPQKLAAYAAAKAARRSGKPGSGGARPNSGRRKGDGARATEAAQDLAARHVQELATLVARHRREMRAWITRNNRATTPAAPEATTPVKPTRPVPDKPRRPRGRPPGTNAIVMALRRDAEAAQ